MDENQQIVVKEDPFSISGEIDISSFLKESTFKSIVKLQGNGSENNHNEANDETVNTRNIENCQIQMEISFTTPIKEYSTNLQKTLSFADMFTTNENKEDTVDATDDTLSVDTKRCLDEMVERLVAERQKFMETTTVQQYDKRRTNEGFIYHLNSSGIYENIKDKLVKPQVLRYLQASSSWNNMFTELIGSLIQDLSDKVALKPLDDVVPTKEENHLFITKNTQIAGDFELTDMIPKARIHYEMAYDRSKGMNPGIHWMTTQNFTKILQKQGEGDQALSVLTDFVRKNNHHHHCLLFLTALCIERDHENAKTVVYELCERHPIPTSLTMKSVYFSLNGQDMRGDITFKKAMNALQHDMNSNLMQDLFGVLFNLQCPRVIGCILDHLQKMEQIDVYFHVNHAKLDAMSDRFGTAMSSIQEAIRINDELPDLWAIKGHLEYDSGKLENAKSSYLQYLQLIPGTAASLLPRPKDSDSILLQLRLNQKLMYRLGKMYEKEGDHRLAAQTYFEAIEFDPEGGSWLFWYEAGSTWFRLQEYEESITCFEQSNMINNNEPHSWCILGLCYLEINEPKQAIGMMKEVLKFGNENISQHDLQRVFDFGEKLGKIGHIQRGKFFTNAVKEYVA